MGIIDRDGFGRRGRSRDAVYSWEFRGRSIEVNLPNRVSILLGGLQVERLSTYVCTL